MTTVLAGDLMTTIASLRRVVRRRLRQARPEPRLPIAQIELLLTVEAEPGIGVAAAARAMGLADNSVSSLVNPLLEAGLLRREVDPADRRAARLQLTDEARDRIARWRRARAELVSRAIDELPPADREALTTALPALNRLLDTLRRAQSHRGAQP